MGTSRVAIAGGAFRVRTGNLCTMFGSLESAAEQIALLHDEIERLRDQHDTYVEMVEQLTRQLDSRSSFASPYLAKIPSSLRVTFFGLRRFQLYAGGARYTVWARDYSSACKKLQRRLLNQAIGHQPR